LIQIKLIK